MREICTSGSEGGVAQTNAPSLPPIKALPAGRTALPAGAVIGSGGRAHRIPRRCGSGLAAGIGGGVAIQDRRAGRADALHNDVMDAVAVAELRHDEGVKRLAMGENAVRGHRECG